MNYLSGGNSHRKKKKDEIDFCSEMVSLSKKSNDRFVGGDKIIDSIISTMAKKKESNVVLVGESGVGKTALSGHGLVLLAAWRMRDGKRRGIQASGPANRPTERYAYRTHQLPPFIAMSRRSRNV